ncbi:hypothetical protein EJB05_22433, partial [Eragrostis curvula]
MPKGSQQMGMSQQQYPGSQQMGMGQQQYPGSQPMGMGPQQYPGSQPMGMGPQQYPGSNPMGVAGQRRTIGPWGGSGGDENTIYLGLSELVKGVSGTSGSHENHIVITSLKIVTNTRTYGPFGRPQDDAFSAPVPGNASIVGFFGRSGDCLDSIGVYT